MKLHQIQEQELDSALTPPIKLTTYDDLMHNSNHAMFQEYTTLDLLNANEQIIKTGTYEEIKQYMSDNWSKMSGQYTFSHKGSALHVFHISHDTTSTPAGHLGTPLPDTKFD